MSASRGLKKAFLLGGLLALAGLALAGQGAGAAVLGLALFAWLAYETLKRTRFRFTDRGRELGLAFDSEVLDLHGGACGVFVEGGGTVTVLPLGPGRTWRRTLKPPPMALLPLSGGHLILAYEDRLSLTDKGGAEIRGLAFEPPLLRQGYRLVADPGGDWVALATPWFVQVADAGLERTAGRLRFEDAGHYFKYAALGPGGRGLLVGGAYLLDEEAGGSLEARWGWWERGDDASWTRRWGQAREGYENSQLRGVHLCDDAGILCTELWRSGYAFELRRPDGTLLWERPGGERPVLSPGGARLVWEKGQDCLVMSSADGTECWQWKPKEQIRMKRPLDDGSCIVLEGRCLRRFSPAGVQGPETWLKNDAAHLALGAGGSLLLAAGRHGALLSLDGGF
ncbi:MAG TPA: hypothetical protein VK914_04940 [bacterium]|jgi:hypothetical protein|nr:hypothetical protein [bacterium]